MACRSSPPPAARCPEVVGTSGESGLLVPPGDPDALAGMLLRALGDAELRARFGEAGRARALDKFTWRATAARHGRELPGAARGATLGRR